MTRPVECPKCAFEQPAGALECVRCGIVFAKWQEPEALPARAYLPQAAIVVDDEAVEDGRIGPRELKILAFGLAAALVVYFVPFLRFVFSALVTLFHELGHAVAAWLLGYPALPAFDFVYGGGYTHYGMWRLSLVVAVGGIFLFGGWLFRRNRKTLAVIAALFALWLVVVTGTWRREIVMAASGHVFEYVLAAILFYQALSGTGWRNPDLERPLGAFVAFFVQIHSMLFALRLRSDQEFLAWYREGKGGMLMNDLEQVALDLHIHLGLTPGIEGVAGWLFLFSFVPIGVALAWYLFRSRCHRVVRALLAPA